MNAGAYGREMKDIVVTVTAVDEAGCARRLTAADCGFGYRSCAVPGSWIFTGADLLGTPESADRIAKRMAEIRTAREDSQPIRSRTGGSTFANPPDARAWELIDRAGCRGLTRGGAKVSEHHCNFLVNTGGATAADLEALGEEVRKRVLDATGVLLHWEIRRIGEAAPMQDREGWTP
jgi:UDP-N-acetylmuramate dehydrogenase